MKTDPTGIAVTIGAALLDSVRRCADATAIVFPDERWTFATLLERASHRARALRNQGLSSGDVIGIAMEDGPEFIALFVGAALSGITPALFAPGVRASILAPRLPFLAIKTFFASGEEGRAFCKMLIEAHALIRRPNVPSIHVEDETYRDFLAGGTSRDFDPVAVSRDLDPTQDAAIVFTSGMTGLPKTCPVSHLNLMCKAAPFAERFELERKSRLWIGVPMFQIGFLAPFLATLAIGATLIASSAGKHERIRAMLKAERVTHAYPIYLQNWLPIVGAPSFQPSDFSELSHICLVGPTTALRRAQRATPQAVVMNTYGSAETAGALCMPRASDPVDVRLGTSGRPFAGHDLRIIDPVIGTPAAQAEVGEIQLRGAGIPGPRPGNEYGSVFTEDGWLRTADLGAIGRNGALTYHGRSSEMLKIGDQAVSAIAIETVLALHRDVAVAQVIARPDKVLGEVAAAFIELRPGRTVAPETLVEFCRKHLPATHVPRYVSFVSDWPTTSSKIYKPFLASMPLGPRLID